MHGPVGSPRIFNLAKHEALEVRETPFGSVGLLFSGEEFEAVWVCKKDEEIDPAWFSQTAVDLLFVVQGGLRVEYQRKDLDAMDLTAGDVLVLPAETKCRAYRWPRASSKETIFLAVYPKVS